MGKLFGGGSQSQTTETNPWGPAKEHLENILQNAGNLFDQQGGINAEWIDKEIADLTPEMQETIKNLVNTDDFKNMAQGMGNAIQSGIGGIGQGSNILGGLANQGITSDKINEMAKDLYNSDLVASQTEQLTADVQKGLSKNIQSLNQQASGSGNMGSSRAGVAEGVAIGEAADAIASGSSAIQNAASQAAMGQAIGTLQGNQNTALGAGQQLGNIGLGSLGQMSNLGNIYQQGLSNSLTGSSILQNYNQNVLNNKWTNAQGQQNVGWDMLNKYMGVAGGIGSMGGTTTTTGSGGGSAGGLGALAGGIGGLMSGAGAMGGSFAGMAAMFSDEKLKKNIKTTGKAETANGKEIRTVAWEWNKKAEEELGLQGKGEGVIAQELAKLDPKAVKTNKKTGFKQVDYTRVKRKNKAKKGA